MIIDVCGTLIGHDQPPFIVAELSGNHNQSIERAKQLIDAAACAGVQAIKLQTYTADTMTLDLNVGEFSVEDPTNLWNGYSLHQLYDKAHTPWGWHQELFDYIRGKGCIPFSSPFDESAVDFLEDLSCPIYKIASFEITDLPLIKKVAETGKPIIMSTGMASISEIDEAVNCARNNGCNHLVLLKCTSTYPATPLDSNLLTIPHLSKMTDTLVGVSDHTLGIGVSVAAVALGAAVIEKHITLDRHDGGVDSSFSMEPDEFKDLVTQANHAWLAKGKVTYGGTNNEEKSKMYRRSLYISSSVSKGDILTKDNVSIIRPALGLSPKYYDAVIGKKCNKDLPKGHPLGWNDFN